MRSRRFQIDSLEQRLLCAVTPVIQVLNGQSTINAGQAVFVNALADSDGNGTTLGTGTPLTAQYQWDFGDTTAGSRYDQLPGWNAGHVYDTPGTYTITLTITDDSGEVGVAQQTVQVNTPGINPTIIYVDNTASGTSPSVPLATGSVTAPSISSALPYLTNNTGVAIPQRPNVQRAANHQRAVQQCHDHLVRKFISCSSPESADRVVATDADHLHDQRQQRRRDQRSAIQSRKRPRKVGEAVRPDGTDIVIRNCQFLNMDDAIMNDQSPVGLMAMDNTAGTLKEYFAFVNGSDQVYLGNTAPGDSSSQHNIRIYGFPHSLLRKQSHESHQQQLIDRHAAYQRRRLDLLGEQHAQCRPDTARSTLGAG